MYYHRISMYINIEFELLCWIAFVQQTLGGTVSARRVFGQLRGVRETQVRSHFGHRAKAR